MQLSAPWRSMLDKPMFQQADCNGCRALEKMLSVFVERSHSLFKVGMGIWGMASCCPCAKGVAAQCMAAHLCCTIWHGTWPVMSSASACSFQYLMVLHTCKEVNGEIALNVVLDGHACLCIVFVWCCQAEAVVFAP